MAGELPERNQSHEIAWPMPVLFEIFIIACGAIMKGLFIPGVTELGASSDSFPSGIVIPGANVMTLPPGEWVDLSDIDLTSSALDYRVSFSCASNHAYYSADGTIQFAAPDVWPLEYRNGVAVGRHEPEPQAPNFLPYSNDVTKFSKNRGVTITTSKDLTTPFGDHAQVITTDGYNTAGINYRIPLTQGVVYCTSLFVHVPSMSSPSLMIGQGAIGGESVTVDFDQRTSTIGNAFKYGFDDFADGWVRYWFSGVSSSTTSAIVVYTGAGANVFSVTGFQVENTATPGSPIITAGKASTRAAAFVSIQNPDRLATSVRVHFTDATYEDFAFPAHSLKLQLPHAATNWGKRYIQRIEYIR